VLSVGRLGKQAAAKGARFGWVGTVPGRVRAQFDRSAGRPTKRAIAVTTAAVAVIAGLGVYLLTRNTAPPPNAPLINNAVTLPGPFRVMSVTPAPGSKQADGSLPVTVTFSAPPSARSPRPTVTPNVAGHWQTTGDSMVFTPSLPFSPSTQITVDIPAGSNGIISTGGHVLAAPTTARYTTSSYSNLRMSEMLAQLGYLPMSWRVPNLGLQTESRLNSDSTGMAGQLQMAYNPPSGEFGLEQGYPASLASLWQPDKYNVVIKGAIMAFQSEHNMSVNGTATPALWTALFRAVMTNQNNGNGYTYAVASQVDPETLTIYHDGQVVLRSLANTGIPASPTANGTFPVYEKYRWTYMSGTNPGGSHYDDLVQFVSYFNGGDAVHYFARGGYGYQQSLGCVELPYGAAEQAFPYLTLGSLVTVTG
jgi:L,D-transpeptidase catalytic domain/Bacterial Ig-like domain